MTGRCKSCDNKLTEAEMRRKVTCNVTHHTEYLELCYQCMYGTDMDDLLKVNIPLLVVDDD